MRLGRGITAARRQASRLAGLVRLPVCCRVKTAIRRQASWLAKKASVILVSRWPFALQNFPSCTEVSHPARGKLARRRLRRKGKSAHSSALQNFPSCTEASHPARGKPAHRQLRGADSLFFCVAKITKPHRSTHPARGKPAPRQLRRSRAAIGSGGKKARPF